MGAVRETGARWPLAAVCAYAMLIPVQPVFTMPDGSPLRFAAADALAPLVLAAGVFAPRRRVPMGLAGVTVAIPLLAMLSTLLAWQERPLSQYALGKTAGLFYLVAVCLSAMRCLPPRSEPAVLRALARGTVLSAALGVAAFAGSFVGIETPLVSFGRLCGTMLGDPNIYCSLLAVGLLVVATDAEASRFGRAVGVIILVLAILATGSRSGLVGVGAGVAVCGLVRSRDPWVGAVRGIVAGLAAVLVVAIVLSSGAGSAAGRALWDHTWRTWTVDSRFVLYERAAQQWSEHPVMGLGIGGFNDLNAWDIDYHLGGHYAVHNTYLWALVDLGIGGGALITGCIAGGILVCAAAARRRTPPDGAGVIAAGLATMAVFNLFVDGFYQRHFWVLMACAFGIAAVPRPRPRVAWERSAGRPRPLAYSRAG